MENSRTARDVVSGVESSPGILGGWRKFWATRALAHGNPAGAAEIVARIRARSLGRPLTPVEVAEIRRSLGAGAAAANTAHTAAVKPRWVTTKKVLGLGGIAAIINGIASGSNIQSAHDAQMAEYLQTLQGQHDYNK